MVEGKSLLLVIRQFAVHLRQGRGPHTTVTPLFLLRKVLPLHLFGCGSGTMAQTLVQPC